MAKERERPRHSVTALLTYLACPLQYYQVFVLGWPPPVTPAMRRGTSIHKLIKDHFSTPSFFPPQVEPDIQQMLTTFVQSRFNVPPLLSEKGFSLAFEGAEVVGRIDLVLPRPDGGLEVVDFKSGVTRTADDMRSHLQLPLYALAAAGIFGTTPQDVAYTYYFLRTGDEVTFTPDSESAGRVKDQVDTVISAIAEGRFEPKRGCNCFACRRDRSRKGRVPPALH